jgi:hypothetical protein
MYEMMLSILAGLFLLCTNACKADEAVTDTETDGFKSQVDSTSFNRGILLFNSDQGKQYWTEFNTQISSFAQESGSVSFMRKYNRENPYLECVSEAKTGRYGVRFSLYKRLGDTFTLPSVLSEKVSGIRFNAVGRGEDTLFVRVLDFRRNVLIERSFVLEKNTMKSFDLAFSAESAKEVVFFGKAKQSAEDQAFGVDDVYLKTNEPAFKPPQSDEAFLNWLKRAAFNFFDWNYLVLGNGKGVLLESNQDHEKVSLSGLGYAYAIYIIAAEDGYITSETAKRRIEGMLNWQLDQNWFDGTGGWHGFAHHYFKPDGTALWPDPSTIDWAMCAAGLRVVRQYYADDAAIQQKVTTLLARADWNAALASGNKIAMGFNGATGQMNPYRWGLAFSEETELVYLEAVASGKLDAAVFGGITRQQKSGFYPSWFGAGFTYNWLQLWTGPMEPYKTNAIAAYKNDAETSKKAFGIPIMGLTACETIRTLTPDGFNEWSQYISNQGGNIHGAGLGEVIQISPAAYGAALALPFAYPEAMQGLREFVTMGFYHEYLGLPDNVRMAQLPAGFKKSPNWNSFDINIGPVILAIEQIQKNRISVLFKKDPAIQEALTKLVNSFPAR